MPHVLIIDDDRQNLAVLAELLTQNGIAHTAVQDATKVESAVQNLKHKVDAVLLDLEMPFMDGYEIFKWLKSKPAFQNVPIVACTVHTNQRQAAASAGFNGFISKPLDIDHFPAQIQDILKGQSVWDR